MVQDADGATFSERGAHLGRTADGKTVRLQVEASCVLHRQREELSVASRAALIRQCISGGPREEDWITRELNAVGAVGRIKHQTTFVVRPRRGNAEYFQEPKLYLSSVRGPQRGGVVDWIAWGGDLQEEMEGDRTPLQLAFELVAKEVWATLSGIVRQKVGFPRLGGEVIAPESRCAVRGGEAEGVLGMIARLPVAGRDRLLHQASDKRRRRRVSTEKLRDRVGNGLAGRGIGELSPKEFEQLLRRPSDESLYGVGEYVGALAVRELKLYR